METDLVQDQLCRCQLKGANAAQWATHCLTHLPYCSSCPIRVAARRPNTHHRVSSESDIVIPLLVDDDCFVKSSNDDTHITILVPKLYPYNVCFSCVVPSKGIHADVVSRVAFFIKDMGLIHFAYRSDREVAVRSLLEEACRFAGRTCAPVTSDDPGVLEPKVLESSDVQAVELVDDDRVPDVQAKVAVPEHSHTGESKPNGLAERAVQQLENHVLTLKAAFETNLKMQIDIKHPILTWLVQRASYALSRYLWGAAGKTGLGRLHGRELKERICQLVEEDPLVCSHHTAAQT